MEWDKGFSAVCYACIVDSATWRDIGTFDIIDGTVTRSVSALSESADLLTRYRFSGEKWIRVYMDTKQDGTAGHAALFTGLAIPPQVDIEGYRKEYSLECYSVLKPAEDILLARGYYVPGQADGGTLIKNLLKVTPAPVVVAENAPVLKNAIIAEQGENNLSMVLKILKAINWRIRIDGSGTIHICPDAAEPSAVFSAPGNDSIEPKLTLKHDWFSCPNVFRAISGDLMAVARDDREESPLSTVTRGREVWKEEAGCSLSENEGITDYAGRRLAEEQAKAYEVRYNRRFHPDITVSDIVGLHYPEQGLDGNYKVTAQRLSLGSGGRTEEQVEYC